MKDKFCSYYTNSKDITSYMVEKLHIMDADLILEPSAGEGIFIDEVLETNKTVRIDALDSNGEAIDILKKKYEHNSAVSIRKTDTLLDEQLDSCSTLQLWLKQTDTLFDRELDEFSVLGGHYTKVIGNPPYGAWQDYKKRDILKQKFAGHYVKETYTLFLLRCISVLKMKGRLSFIIPDTYLFLNMHSRLRKMLFTNTKIDEILIFPSKFFPGVSFGYSNLSIITLERCSKEEALDNTFHVICGFHSPSEFEVLLKKDGAYPEHLSISKLKQSEILKNEQYRVIVAETKTRALLSDAAKRLGDVADIVTGFYTGDNKKFIRAYSKTVKGAKNYEVVDPQQIYSCTSLYGIPDVKKGYIPYVKGASQRRYIRQNDEWFVRWDKETIDFYNKNKKTRFQNKAFYFRKGIGMPMVKSSTIRAFVMENRVFDQSIVGIFPKDMTRFYYLLALINSDVMNKMIYAINPTANNSANYIKQLPYKEPTEEILQKITCKVQKLIACESESDYENADKLHDEINSMIERLYQCQKL